MKSSVPKILLASVLVVLLGVVPHVQAGASGHGSFENDDALDWVENALKPAREKAVAQTIAALANSTEQPEAPQCCAAIAACEVLAAVRGKAAKDLPEDVAALARQLSRSTLAPLLKTARAALDKILADSELRDLWAESGEFETWKKSIADLKARLADDERETKLL